MTVLLNLREKLSPGQGFEPGSPALHISRLSLMPSDCMKEKKYAGITLN
jgi:hypothetical protein